MVKQIFVNLPVHDLQATMEFFGKLGFTFNEQFTDENATCMVIGENLYVMLLTEAFFQTFITKEIADTTKVTEVLNALSVESREEVDEMMDKAVEAGATESREPQDQGFMYSRAFEDLDGHIWEIFYMDMSQAPQTPGA
jgi:uncharacterized protein